MTETTLSLRHSPSFLLRRALAALCLVLPVAAFLAVPGVRAADIPVVTASPGTLYQLGTFQRRGVTILQGGTLEIRADGCWRTDMTIVNENPTTRLVSVSYRWHGRGGRTIATIGAVSGLPVEPGARVAVTENGCSGVIARNYGTLSRIQVVRFMSVR